MAKQIRPVIVYGNDTTLYIRMKRFDKSTGDYIDFSMEQVTDLSVSLICSQHNTDIPLTFTVDGNLITCAIEYRLLHPNASYGIIVEGIDEDQKHFRFEMLSREGFLVVSNTSGMRVDDNIETIDIQGRVGWGISYNGDLTNYYTKSEVDNLIAEIEIDLSDYYTKEEINQLVNQFPTKSEIDARFNDYYTKTQVNGLISDLEDIVEDKQDTLVSGSNIKTINNESILGEGNIDIQGGGGSVEPIIVTYREKISAETMTKIKEQKTNVWMKIGEQNYLLTNIRTMDGWGATLTFIVTSPKSHIDGGDVVDNGQIYVQIFQYFEVFEKWFNKSYTIDDHSIIENLFNEQFKTTADALWDLDNRLNRSEYITNKKLESIEDSTKDTLDEFGDNINEQLSVAANTLMEHSERLAVQSDWDESDTTSLAYIQNKPSITQPVQSDWNESDSSSLAYIQNKPTIQPQVQSDWDESDTTSLAYIQNKPTISTPVQSDWNESDSTSLAYIQNKPSISEPKTKYYVDINWENWPKNTTWQGEHAICFRRINLIDTTTGTIVYQAAPSSINSLNNILNILYNTYHIRADISVDDMQISTSHLTFTPWNNYYLMYLPQQINSVDNGSILKFRFYERDANFNLVNYCNDVLIPIMPGKGRLVSSSTAGLKIEVVSALPASPDANTIYIVQ